MVTGVERKGDSEANAYFKRDFCVNELRWAREVSIPMQPVIQREDNKRRIGEFIGQAPMDLKDLSGVDFKTLDQIGPAIWKTCVGGLDH